MKASLEKSFFIKENYNDEMFYGALINEFEELIEKELSKEPDEIDENLIDDCCKAIEALQLALTGEEPVAFVAVSGANEIIRKYNKKLRKNYIAAAACASVALLCAAVAARTSTQISQGTLREGQLMYDVLQAFGVKISPVEDTTSESALPSTTEKTVTTTTVTQDNTVQESSASANIPPQSTEGLENTTLPAVSKPTKPVATLYNISILLPPGFSSEFEAKEDINLDNAYAILYYSDSTEKTVPVSECDVFIGEADSNGRVKVTVTYEHRSASIYVSVRSADEKGSVTLNSIYGNFNGGYNIGTMTVFAVYSDGTEKEIPQGEYSIRQEYSEDFEADVVIVEYGGCSFQFIPQT